MNRSRLEDKNPAQCEQDARVREPSLLLVHTMIERQGEMCITYTNALQPI